MASVTKQMDLAYSFGGTREEPLVHGIVPFTYDSHIHSCVQEAFLERTEMFLTVLTTKFDNALKIFDDVRAEADARLRALDVMVSTVVFTTRNILTQSPGVHYALMFTRIQEVFKRTAVIQTLFGNAAVENMESILKPAWVDLRAIDQSFGRSADGDEASIPLISKTADTTNTILAERHEGNKRNKVGEVDKGGKEVDDNDNDNEDEDDDDEDDDDDDDDDDDEDDEDDEDEEDDDDDEDDEDDDDEDDDEEDDDEDDDEEDGDDEIVVQSFK